MLKLKIAAGAVIALGALAGVASAAGVFEHEDPAMDRLQAKQVRLEDRFEARAGGQAEAGASAVRGPRGKRGARGPRGPQGPAGPRGTFGTITSVEGPSTFLCGFFVGSCAVGSTQAACPAGTTLVGGGYKGAGIVTTVTWSAPVGNAWGIIAVNLDEVSVPALRAVAQCAGA